MNFSELKIQYKITNPDITLSIVDVSNDDRHPVYYIAVNSASTPIGQVRLGRFEKHISTEDQEYIQINRALSNIKNLIP